MNNHKPGCLRFICTCNIKRQRTIDTLSKFLSEDLGDKELRTDDQGNFWTIREVLAKKVKPAIGNFQAIDEEILQTNSKPIHSYEPP